MCVIDGMQPNSQTKYEWHGNEANSFPCTYRACIVCLVHGKHVIITFCSSLRRGCP